MQVISCGFEQGQRKFDNSKEGRCLPRYAAVFPVSGGVSRTGWRGNCRVIESAGYLASGAKPFVTLKYYVGFTKLSSTMKRIALPSLFVLLSVVLCLARTVSDDYTANAIKGVLRLQESLHDPDTLQVSRAIATSKGLCIEYRSRNESGRMGAGFAVYKTDKDLVWVDNSWLWDQVCIVGKYGQRREGKDVTDAVKAAIDGKQTSAIKIPPPPSAPRREDPTTPAVQLVVPVARVATLLRATIPVPAVSPKAGVSSQTAHAAPLPSSVVTSAPTAQTPVATVAPAPARTVGATQATTVNMPVKTPAPTVQASIEVTVVPVSVAPTTGFRPSLRQSQARLRRR